MDEASIKRTKEIFTMCDADGDGVITKAELFKLVKELGYDCCSVASSPPKSLEIESVRRLMF